MSNQVGLNIGRERIFPVLIFYIRQCYNAHNNNLMYGRNEILTLIDMCVDSLLQLETNPQEIENIIVSLGLRAFPRNYERIYWYLNRILNNNIISINNIKSIGNTEPSTRYDSEEE